jgi:hypothetical protein
MKQRWISLRGAAVTVIAALAFALVAAAPSAVMPGGALAGAPCHDRTCNANNMAGVWCNGSFFANQTSCSTVTASNVSGHDWCQDYPNDCGANASICNGTFNGGCNCSGFDANCPFIPATSTGVWCNGTFEAGFTNCPDIVATTSPGVWCDGTFFSDQVSCPVTTAVVNPGVTCDGVFYADQDFCPTTTFTTTVNPVVTATVGTPVTFQAGWNIVADANGAITGNVGPLYAFGPGSTSYEVLPPGTPLQPGMGAWAFFNAPVTETMPFNGSSQISVQLPPGQFVMIGNDGSTPATVNGADIVLTWNGSTYQQVTTLNPGQGAWAFSQFGSEASIVNTPI